MNIRETTRCATGRLPHITKGRHAYERPFLMCTMSENNCGGLFFSFYTLPEEDTSKDKKDKPKNREECMEESKTTV